MISLCHRGSKGSGSQTVVHVPLVVSELAHLQFFFTKTVCTAFAFYYWVLLFLHLCVPFLVVFINVNYDSHRHFVHVAFVSSIQNFLSNDVWFNELSWNKVAVR